MPLSAGSRLGPYEIVARLASGGMGVVYRARDSRLDREVAVKVLPEDVAADPERLRRFEREARAIGALEHPNVVAVHDLGSDSGVRFIVTELLEGETLREHISAGALSPRKAVELAVQMAHGLAAAHERGIVHRDLKPENLFLTRDGRIKILDFGLAKVRQDGAGAASEAQTWSRDTNPGAILGTLHYLSPEQARGHEADSRSDIFAFGAVLYEMLCGRPAFSGPSAADTLSAILREDPPSLRLSGVPAGLERVVTRCLEKDPRQRFGSARDLAFALEAVDTAAAVAGGAPAARSVAVLPFKDLARSPENAHIGLGLADATITELARARALLVRPTAAMLRYQDRSVDPQQAARELTVDAVVDGSFQRAGEKLRVTVQLVSADGRSLWASKIDASLGDVFAMQDEVSQRIAEALHVELGGAAERRPPMTVTRARAGSGYELYLRGRLSLFHGRLAGVNAAIDAFEQARDLEPGFAPAWAGLADAYLRMAFEHAPEGDWYARAIAMCARALELDPALPEGRYVRGRLAWSPSAGFDHATALSEASASLLANPALVQARYLVGLVLFHVGLVDESEAEWRRVLAADPDDSYAQMHLASCRLHQGRFAEAVQLSQAGLRAFSDRWSWTNLALSQLRLGRLEEAARTIERLTRESPDFPQVHSLGAVLSALQGDADRTRRGVELTRQLRQDFGHYHHAQYDVASALAVLGDLDAAIAWLRAAADNGYPCPTLFAVDPLLDPLRGRDDFAELMRELEQGRDRYERLYREGLSPSSP